MLTQFKRLSLVLALVSVFSITPRVRTRFVEHRYTCTQEQSGVTVEMTELNRRERDKTLGHFFNGKLNKKNIVPVKVKVKNSSAETVTLAKTGIGLPQLRHEDIMARLKGVDKWKRRSAAVVTTGSGLATGLLFGLAVACIVKFQQGACGCILVGAFFGLSWGIVACGIASTCGVYWYKEAYAFDKYNAYMKTSWKQGKLTLTPGEEREEIIFVNKQDIENPYQVTVTSAGHTDRTYDMRLEKTRV